MGITILYIRSLIRKWANVVSIILTTTILLLLLLIIVVITTLIRMKWKETWVGDGCFCALDGGDGHTGLHWHFSRCIGFIDANSTFEKLTQKILLK